MFVYVIVLSIVAETFFRDILRYLVISIYLKSKTNLINFGKMFVDQAEGQMSLSDFVFRLIFG